MRKILIVDDEVDFLETVEFYLSKKGFEISTANNGREALEKLEVSLPDLILMDSMMPVMDGVTACKTIRKKEKFKHIPIIMFTAKSGAEDIKEAMSHGANDYIIKPFVFEKLVERIKKVMNIGFGYNTIDN